MTRAIHSSSGAALLRRQLSDLADQRMNSTSRGVAALRVDWKPLAGLNDGELERWRDLMRRAIEPNVFLEPAFALAAAVHLEKGVGALTVRAGSRLVGLLPGRIEGFAKGYPVATFRVWTHPFAPLSTPLIDREAAEEVVAAVLDALPTLPGAPRLALFPFTSEEGVVARLIADCLLRASRPPYRLDPHMRAAFAPGKGDPLAAVSLKRLKELGRQHRRLAEQGTLSRETVTESDKIIAAISDYLTVETKGWKGRTGGAAALDPASARFLFDAVSGLAREGKARVDLLKLDGKTIAAAITLLSRDRAWFWKIAYDEALARFSPGVQLALNLTETLGRERGIALVDSCAIADHPMIDHLWGERLAVADWLVPLGGAGSFMAGIIAERGCRALIASLKALRGRLRR